MNDAELRELTVFVVVGSWLVLAVGSGILGLGVGVAVGLLRRDRRGEVVYGLLGMVVGLVGGPVYFCSSVEFPPVDGSRYRGLWLGSCRWSLWMGLAGAALVALTQVVRYRRGMNAPPGPPPNALTKERCYHCGRRLVVAEAAARVCRRCQE